jgi:hypothetical protein
MSDDLDSTPASVPPLSSPATPPAPVSVVLDTNATVAISHRPIYMAIAAVLAFVLFSALWFAARESDDYVPGPVAQALLDAIRADGGDVAIPGEELACVDRAGTGIDPDDLRNGIQLTDASLTSAERDFIGTVYDDCFSRDTRVALFAENVTFAGEPVTGEKALCVGERLDDAVMRNGGYTALADGPGGQVTFIESMLGAMAGCGVMGG